MTCVVAWLGVHEGENFACHSRAITSKVSVSAVPACFMALRTLPGRCRARSAFGLPLASSLRFGKGDFRIGAKADSLVLLIEAVLEMPVFAARRSHKKVKAPAVEQLVLFLPGLWRS